MPVPVSLLGRVICTFEYTNWRNETEVRRVVPDRVSWMDEPGFGYAPGWFLVGWDLHKDAMRQYSLDPARMRPINDAGERTPLSSHGINILLQVR